MRLAVALLALLLAACATRVPTPAELEARRLEPVAGKAVLYLFRSYTDLDSNAPVVMLDGQMQGASYRGTYFRFVLAPGRHQLTGYAADNGRFDFNAEAGQVYFIRHTVSRLGGFDQSLFIPASPADGRAAVLQYELNNPPAVKLNFTDPESTIHVQ